MEEDEEGQKQGLLSQKRNLVGFLNRKFLSENRKFFSVNRQLGILVDGWLTVTSLPPVA